MKDITALQIFLIGISLMIFWSVFKGIYKWIVGKKKPKFKWEYEVKMFVGSEVIWYTKEDILKVKHSGRKYIEIKLQDGSWIEYEGFNYIIQAYKIDLSSTHAL